MSGHRVIAAILLLLFTGWAQAQAPYPNKPVHLIMPFPAGGSADAIARSIAQQFIENTKQPMIIENRPAADTIIGMQAVKNAAPDGYSMGDAIGSALTINPILYKSLPYALSDFVPVTVVADLATGHAGDRPPHPQRPPIPAAESCPGPSSPGAGTCRRC